MKRNMLAFVSVIAIILDVFSVSGMIMTGGWSHVEDVNSEDIQKLAKFATANISARSNSIYLMRPMEVTSAEKQVVSGMNYKINMTIGATECKKKANSTNVDLDQCKFLPCKAEICSVVVWVQSWRNSTKLTKFNCVPAPKSEGC